MADGAYCLNFALTPNGWPASVLSVAVSVYYCRLLIVQPVRSYAALRRPGDRGAHVSVPVPLPR